LPESPPLRIYLDSNVLFSASRDAASRFRGLWSLENILVITSPYAVGEVSRNIESSGHRGSFDALLAQTRFVSDASTQIIPTETRLVAKDRPILAAAIAASVDYLVTGDKRHFEHLYGRRIGSVAVIGPADFLDLYEDRLPE